MLFGGPFHRCFSRPSYQNTSILPLDICCNRDKKLSEYLILPHKGFHTETFTWKHCIPIWLLLKGDVRGTGKSSKIDEYGGNQITLSCRMRIFNFVLSNFHCFQVFIVHFIFDWRSFLHINCLLSFPLHSSFDLSNHLELDKLTWNQTYFISTYFNF